VAQQALDLVHSVADLSGQKNQRLHEQLGAFLNLPEVRQQLQVLATDLQNPEKPPGVVTVYGDTVSNT